MAKKHLLTFYYTTSLKNLKNFEKDFKNFMKFSKKRKFPLPEIEMECKIVVGKFVRITSILSLLPKKFGRELAFEAF